MLSFILLLTPKQIPQHPNHPNSINNHQQDGQVPVVFTTVVSRKQSPYTLSTSSLEDESSNTGDVGQVYKSKEQGNSNKEFGCCIPWNYIVHTSNCSNSLPKFIVLLSSYSCGYLVRGFAGKVLGQFLCVGFTLQKVKITKSFPGIALFQRVRLGFFTTKRL